ncbi:hypothetical protein NMA58_16625 [Rhizobium sp. YTUHZ045]|uniref:hypothetical protein n=1 Tax=Rhizobium sp. YTUHZ045 TaxID=2962888 RepID=UPI003DA7C42D
MELVLITGDVSRARAGIDYLSNVGQVYCFTVIPNMIRKDSTMIPKISVKFLDLMLASLLAVEILYIMNNTHFHVNWELYRIYTSGRYKNFDRINEHDEMFVAANKMIDCKKPSTGSAVNLEIMAYSIFFIETSLFLEVAYKKTKNGHCVDHIIFRTMPG